MTWIKRGLLALVVVFVLIQLVPVDRSSPVVRREVVAPPAARAVLERACYDCHSHETRWPWYSRVAPASWLMSRHVSEGREHLNLSAWDDYGPGKRRELIGEIAEKTEKGAMPPRSYLWLHPVSRLDDGDRAALRAWAASGDAGEGEAAGTADPSAGDRPEQDEVNEDAMAHEGHDHGAP